MRSAVGTRGVFRLVLPRALCAAAAAAPPRGALHGVRVLDLSRILAGPICTQMLGDLGADVIKVERPTLGDDTRHWGPPFAGNSNESAYFLGCNRSKRSITVNMKAPRGKELILDLARKSDVVVENFLPGALGRLGLGYEAMKAVNPGIVMCSITGYGQSGPEAHKPGYDLMVEGAGGLISITGPQTGEDCKVGVAIIDVLTGVQAMGAISAALFSRTVTGLGQHIDCALLDTQIAALANVGSNYLVAGLEGRKWGTAHESIVPYQRFDTADGGMIVAGANDKQFVKLCEVLGLTDLGADPRFATNKQRVHNRTTLLPLLQDKIKQKTTAEWTVILDDARLPFAPINSISQAHNQPQVKFRGMVQELEHPTAGRLKTAACPVKFSGTPASTSRPPPTLGQHTTEVLRDVLGLSLDDIAALRAEGVV